MVVPRNIHFSIYDEHVDTGTYVLKCIKITKVFDLHFKVELSELYGACCIQLGN